MVFTSADLMNIWNGSSWQVGAGSGRMSRSGGPSEALELVGRGVCDAVGTVSFRRALLAR